MYVGQLTVSLTLAMFRWVCWAAVIWQHLLGDYAEEKTLFFSIQPTILILHFSRRIEQPLAIW